MDRPRADRPASPSTTRFTLAVTLGLGVAAFTASCSSSKIPFFGRSDSKTAPTPAELAEERRQAAIAEAVIEDGGKVTKVKYFHLQQNKDYFAADTAIPFEARYLLHGAVTQEERGARYGNYYEVFWKTKTPGSPAKVTLQYRQELTGATERAQSVTIDSPRGRNTTKFQVTGDEYSDAGAVTAWRVSVEQDGRTVAATQSFLWD